MVEEVTEGVVTDSGAAVGAEETEKHSISEEPVSQYSPAVNVFADIATLISLPRVLVAVTVILYMYCPPPVLVYHTLSWNLH